MFLIESLEHGPIGNSRVWWRPRSCGYTTDLDDAGRYTEEQARRIVEGARGNEVAWPVELVETAASRHVRSDLPLDRFAQPIRYEGADPQGPERRRA